MKKPIKLKRLLEALVPDQKISLEIEDELIYVGKGNEVPMKYLAHRVLEVKPLSGETLGVSITDDF